jgi:hypothetical protein
MAYWILTVALIAFGFIGSFSIGQPFLLLGMTMLVLGPVRRRPLVFWPPMLGVVAAVVVFMAIAPFSCSGTLDGSGPGGATTTVCTSLIGIRYEMQGFDNPSLQPPILIGLGAGIVTALLTFALLWRRTRSGPRRTGP